MRCDDTSDIVVSCSKRHATPKRNNQLLPAPQWLRLLMNHLPDEYEHLVRYYGYYSNRSRGARRLAEQERDTRATVVVERPVDNRRKANRARLIQKAYAIDPLKCTQCGTTMRIIALIDDAGLGADDLKCTTITL